MSAEQVTAIGRLPASRVWVGFSRTRGRCSLVFGEPSGRLRSGETGGPAHRLDLLLVALAYFAESAEEPPPDLEATHADLAALLRWLTDTEADAQLRLGLREAVDAIDDGLSGEAVAGALARVATAIGGDQVERADPLDLLMDRYRTLRD